MLNISNELISESHSDELITFGLYEVYYSDLEPPLCITNWDDEVVYQGKTYLPTAVQHSTISQNTGGQMGDVTLSVGNLDRIIQKYIDDYELIGKKVRVIQFFIGSSTGNVQGTFRIEGITVKKDAAAFTLSVGCNYLQASFPSRLASSRHCMWQFKSSECGYTGSDENCSKTIEDCIEKGNVHRVGCFPGIINERIYV